MRVVRIVVLAFLLSSCAELTRTNQMLNSYLGKSIDSFMTEQGFAYRLKSPLDAGGAVYQFTGGPGGPRCVFYVTTDSAGIIKSYRFENC